MNHKEIFHVYPVGYIRRDNERVTLEILEEYRPALKQLSHFSHLTVLWWVTGHDNPQSRSTLDCYPPYAEDKLTGVFATRSEYRQNPIAVTTCKILEIDEQDGIIKVNNLDAYAGTPILDLKAYFPVLDRISNATLPEWLSFFPDCMPEEGVGIME